MNRESGYSLGELDRRVGNVVRFGAVHAVDHAAALVQVDLGEVVTDWVPWIAPRAGQDRVWSPPSVGEQVVLVCPGDPSQGVVLGALWQDAHPANGSAGKDHRITFKDGTVVEMDTDSSTLQVTVGQTQLRMQPAVMRLACGASVLEITPDGIRLTGPRIDFN